MWQVEWRWEKEIKKKVGSVWFFNLIILILIASLGNMIHKDAGTGLIVAGLWMGIMLKWKKIN